MSLLRRAAAASPATATLDEARAAWNDGNFERLLIRLNGVAFERREDRVAAALLRARALLALHRADEAIAAVESSAGDVGEPEETVAFTALLGTALTRTNEREKGEALLEEAAAGAQRSAPALASEVAYYRALSRWSVRALPEAEQIIEAALPAAQDLERARLLQMLGWIDVRRENYGAASGLFTAALDELDKAKSPCPYLRAKIVQALGIIAAETIDLRLGRLVRRAYQNGIWTEGTRIERFRILESLSYLSLLEGDLARAWDERQLALMLTGDTSYHAIALVGAATISAIVGDRFAESRYLDLAGHLILRGDQIRLDVEQRIAMLSFAAASGTSNAETARKVLTLFDRTRPRRTQMFVFENDRRHDAYEFYARGMAALAEGATAQGIAALERSLDLWTRLGYRLRTAMTANVLRGVTGDRRYAQIALEALRNAPKAWLREALERRMHQDDPLAQLTPAERRVLAELCKGKKAREIAAAFGRSFNTINNHTRAIFSAFGVRSRAALVAECARLGILDDVASLR